MIHRKLASIAFCLFAAGAAYAQCKSESGEQYQADIDSCNARYLDPEDAAELRSCVQSAYDDFAESFDDCDDTRPFYESWQQKLAKMWRSLTDWSGNETSGHTGGD